MNNRVVVFAGPSIRRNQILRVVPEAAVAPPVRRGDLVRACSEGARLICIVDGSFGHAFAVSPGEVVDVARSGVRIVGSSSMGALRAAECWPAGVHGVGVVYEGYRSGRFTTDDEVAVSHDADGDFIARSVPLVHIRAAVDGAVVGGEMSVSEGLRLVDVAKETHFSERRWAHLLARAGLSHELEDVLAAGPDLKLEDALAALRWVAAQDLDAIGPVLPVGSRPFRSVGHDRFLGHSADELMPVLSTWLLGSGRFQPYIWPVVMGEPEFSRVPGLALERRALEIREALGQVLARLLTEPAVFTRRLWEELEYVEELDRELMFFEAVSGVAGAEEGEAGEVAQWWARETVAVAHGYRSWLHLQTDVVGDRVYGSIPMGYVKGAIDLLARAHARSGPEAA